MRQLGFDVLPAFLLAIASYEGSGAKTGRASLTGMQPRIMQGFSCRANSTIHAPAALQPSDVNVRVRR